MPGKVVSSSEYRLSSSHSWITHILYPMQQVVWEFLTNQSDMTVNPGPLYSSPFLFVMVESLCTSRKTQHSARDDFYIKGLTTRITCVWVIPPAENQLLFSHLSAHAHRSSHKSRDFRCNVVTQNSEGCGWRVGCLWAVGWGRLCAFSGVGWGRRRAVGELSVLYHVGRQGLFDVAAGRFPETVNAPRPRPEPSLLPTSPWVWTSQAF